MTDQQTATHEVAPDDLTRFQLDAMLVIHRLDAQGTTSYGLAIKARLDAYYETEINHGRLYPNLNALVEDGLLAKTALDDRTNEYTLTDLGRIVLRERAQWVVNALDADTGGDA